ncbi:MAG TPA: transposase, partial [Kiritimatiellia bacterium]|nr:transposase [Kiritimatiellia bacterium]
AWNALLAALQTENWIVYPKAAYNATLVLDYLGRYTHKAAISDHRIKSLANGLVTYSWRDRQDDNREKLVTIPWTFAENGESIAPLCGHSKHLDEGVGNFARER